MFIDTHCHLDFKQFDEDRENVIQRAIKNNIDAIITIGTDLKSSRSAVALAENFATIYAAVGIHPSECTGTDETILKQIEELTADKRVIAIGEIGLDYYRMYAPAEKQKEIYRQQLKLARRIGRPIIIHNREAHEDVLKLALEEGANETGGVFHSFTGDENFLNQVIEENFFVSFTGAVTFKNSDYNSVLKAVPLENLLLETDSPFLAPVPFRGKRNEPGYIKYTAEKIAEVKSISVKELAEITSSNARTLFKLAG